MRARIDAHRAHRPTTWQTIEAPRHVAHALQQARVNPRVVVIDCLTLLVSNILLVDKGEADAELIREMDELVAWQRSQALEMIVVSNEVGQGIVPDHALGRAYRDLLGTTNQHIARQADQVFLMVAGLPIEVKSRAVHLENS